MKKKIFLSCLLSASFAGNLQAAPYVPENDSVVLSKAAIPAEGELLDRVRAAREALRKDPGSVNAALKLSRENIELSRRLSDQSYLGIAEATLAPWLGKQEVHPDVRVMYATILQSRHEFEQSVKELQKALQTRPGDPQALLTLATIETVRGNYNNARSACEQLGGRVSELISAACMGSAEGLNGNAASSMVRLRAALDSSSAAPAGERQWAMGILAELAERTGDRPIAEALYKEALAIGPDPYLSLALSDFYRDGGNLAAAEDALDGLGESEGVVVRRAMLASRRAPDSEDSKKLIEELQSRFAHRKVVKDEVHLREEAMFHLEISRNYTEALGLADRNFQSQKEPLDLRLLMQAAARSGDAGAAKRALDFLASSRLEDVRLNELKAEITKVVTDVGAK